MNIEKLKEHLITLSQLTGPSGYEAPIRAYVREVWGDLVDRFEVDGLGSLVGIKYGTGAEPRKRIMLSAHMDEIGLIVKTIKNGYLLTDRLGGTDPRTTLAKTLSVHTRNGEVLKGVIAVPPPHITGYTGGQDEYPMLDHQWVDLGLSSEEVEAKVRVGDVIVLDAPVVELGKDLIATKAMDDRCSVASVTACLEYLQSRRHEWDVYAVASVQEEVGLQGATTAAYHVAPDIAIAIDVGFASQPGVSGDAHVNLNEGPQIGIGPNFHDGLRENITSVAKTLDIELPLDPTPAASGTDAWAIQISRLGVPTTLFSIPIRNMHSTVETVSLKMVQRTGRLMAEFITSLGKDYMESLAMPLGAEENGDKEDES